MGEDGANQMGLGSSLLSVRLLCNAALGLLDPIFIGRIGHAKFTKPLVQLFVRRVELKGMKPRLSRVSRLLLLDVDFSQMLIEHWVIAH